VIIGLDKGGSRNKTFLNFLYKQNNIVLKSVILFLLFLEEFDFIKDRYQEEEDLLPDQIKHFLKHVNKFNFIFLFNFLFVF